MLEQLKELAALAEVEIKEIKNLDSLNDLRVKYLGKKGPIQEVMKSMKDLTPDERRTVGQISNDVKRNLSEAINAKKEELELADLNKQLANEKIDVTLPGKKTTVGGLHPLNGVIADIEEFFIGMGYNIAEGTEVESDHYSFELLNLPKDHPARDMQDSFYITENILLRPHTSPIQVRTLEVAKGVGPVKILCPGKVYRRDNDDATHSHQFMQIEGLLVDKHITMADLKGTLEAVAKHLFGNQREIRMRPSFFPFTEPSVEVDVSCFACNGDGCSVCKKTGWLEILGAGMVHPNVLKMSGFDPDVYRGFAFGMGIERIAMLKYGIPDIRYFYTNDMRFLMQFTGGVR